MGPQYPKQQGKSNVSLRSRDHRYSNTATKVEGEAQGDDDVIQTFLKDVDRGPAGSKVVKLDTEDRDVAEGEIGFELRY